MVAVMRAALEQHSFALPSIRLRLPSLALPRRAVLYLLLVAAAAAGAAAGTFPPVATRDSWALWVGLTFAATIAQLYIVEKPGNQSYRTAIVFIVAAAILLHPAQVVLLTALHYIPGSLKHGKSRQVVVFNISNSTLAALAGWVAYHHTSLGLVGAGATTAATFVVVNHALLAVMLHLASGTRLGETRLFSVESLATDAALAATGVAAALAWQAQPWAIVFPIAPLFLIHRALYVPQLQVAARFDAKTGLLNAREFFDVLAAELERADRTGVPVTVLMADLDFLREINNTRGHLAGDAVLRGVADVFRLELRRYDVAARFGGEEFMIMLPATRQQEGIVIAERIRAAVADQPYAVDDGEPLRATISIGVASFPEDGGDAEALFRAADRGVYLAKAAGRNRVDVAPPE
jgi:diguanylate cyclase (GGDEF)-like protein